MAFSADGQKLSVYVKEMPSRDDFPRFSAVRQWHVATGKELRSIELPAKHFAEQIAYSPGGELIAVAHSNRTVSLYETTTGTLRGVLGTAKPNPGPSWYYQRRFEPIPIRMLAFSPDGRMLVVSSSPDAIGVWDTSRMQELGQLKGHVSPVNAAAFSPDGKSIITAGNDTTLIVWEAPQFSPKAIAPGKLTDKQIEAHWQNLLETDAKKAFASIQALAGSEACVGSRSSRLRSTRNSSIG
jgi:WD40 repeat protein